MGVNNLSKVFGPTLIGYSSSDPEPMQIMAETGKQAKVGSELTHWGLDKMAAIFQMTLSEAFSWMKLIVYGYKFYLALFLMAKIGLGNGFVLASHLLKPLTCGDRVNSV